MIGFKPSTDGEVLYDILVKRFVNNTSGLKDSMLNLQNFDIGGRKSDFADYYSGIFCFNLTARLIKSAKFLIEQPDIGDALQFGNMLEFLCNQLNISEFSFKKSDVHLLVNLSFEAARSSEQTISNTTKKSLIRDMDEFSCYICGREVFIENEDPKYVMQYEHVWPRSYGGNSSNENLLPACSCCNNAKGSMLLWQDSHVHSFILKPNPSADEITRIPRIAKIAKHRQAIFEYACSKHSTLKEAAVEIGPYDFANIEFSDLNDSSDFFTFHF
jgi:hypothetical protein